jgi:MazG family protein
MTQPKFTQLVDLMARLRGPGGCPWDREQTFDTIKPYLLEETYEVVDAIGQRNWDELAGELGDLLLQIVFFAQMAAEEGHFTIDDVIERIHTKMVRRHPHVFGEARADSAADVLRNWDKLKAEEQRQQFAEKGESYKRADSVLQGVSSSIPALMEAYQLSSRAAHVGFDWKRLEDLYDQMRQEMRELAAVKASADGEPQYRKNAALYSRLEDEAGDVLFTAVNISRFLSVDPESALRRTNQKFRRRFEWMEEQLKQIGKSPRDATLQELDDLWRLSKQVLEHGGS